MNKRRILKTISWRAIGTVLTGGTVLLVTGSLPVATGAAVADSVIKLIAYYLHEAAWDKKETVDEIVEDITGATDDSKCCGGGCHTDTEEDCDKPETAGAPKVRGKIRINDRNRR